MTGQDGSPSELQPGQRVGKYVLKRRLGAGAMGVVFAGEHEALGREVAVKVLRGEFTSNEGVVERFQREAEAVSKIGHANIVSVYDFGRLDDGSLYYVMERINGETLTARMRRPPPLEAEETLHLFAQICRALQATHTRGVVHRDLKPDNIMLVPQPGRLPHVKVVDFGVAKMREAAGAKGQTAAGTVLGTPAYMAPEQITSAPLVDGRADIYALGAILYVILTGKLVFEGEMMQVLVAQLQQQVVPPSLRTTRPIPPALEAVVMKALAKSPAARQPDAATFLAELEAAWGAPKKSATGPMAPVAQATPAPIAQPLASAPTVVASAAPEVAAAGGVPAPVSTAQATTATSRSKRPLILGIAAAVGIAGGAAALVQGRGGNDKPVITRPAQRTAEQRAAESIIAEAIEGEVSQRRAAIDAMGTVGDPGALPQLIGLIGDTNASVAREAAEAASLIGRPGDKQLLGALAQASAALFGPAGVDVAAARFRLGDKAAEDTLRGGLTLRDLGARLSAALALSEADRVTPAVLRDAVEGAPASRRRLRQAAFARLAKIDPSYKDELRKRAAGPDPKLAVDAWQALARTGDDEAKAKLAALAETDAVEGVEAAVVLAELADAHGRPALTKALASKTATVRARAATAIGHLAALGVAAGDRTAELSPLLHDEDAGVRVCAAAALLGARADAAPARTP